MWHVIFDFVITAVAVTCCAFSVKLTDDWLDQEHDRLAGRKNWANQLGIGTMLYAMLLLILAASLQTTVSLALFLASYIIGMFHDLTSRFPLGLLGWQESLAILLISIVLFGWQNTIFSLLFVTGMQLLDDCYDVIGDRLAGQRNFAAKLGQLECFLLATLFLLMAWSMDQEHFFPVTTGAAVAYFATIRERMVNRHA